MGTNFKHSKLKNTGVLFELLTRQITSDILNNTSSRAVNILKRYFNNTELSKEYKLYESLSTYKVSEDINSFINSLIKESSKLDKNLLDKEKYNLIKEIKKHYNLESFLQSKVKNYKLYGSLYGLLEINNSKKLYNPELSLKFTKSILECFKSPKAKISEEVELYDKEDYTTKLLIQKLLVERFNKEYNDKLNESQKSLLQLYINNVSLGPNVKEYYNKEINSIIPQIQSLKESINDEVVKVKINEILKGIKIIKEHSTIKDSDIESLMNYYQLIKELKNVIK